MNKILIILILFNSVLIYSQSTNADCNDLSNGTFELYENNEKIGAIYRKGNYQIEKYLDSDKYTIAKTKFKNCSVSLKNHEIKQDIDTITWSLSYKKIKDKHYSFIGKPKYLKVTYTYTGEIKKEDNEIKNKKILKIFKGLESN